VPVKKQQLETCVEQLTGTGLRKEYDKAVYCHPFIYLTEHIMRNVGLGELQAGIRIAGRNIISLRYADDTVLQGMELEHSLKTIHKNSKWIENLNVTPETIKLMEEDIGRTLFDINHSSVFWICLLKQK